MLESVAMWLTAYVQENILSKVINRIQVWENTGSAKVIIGYLQPIVNIFITAFWGFSTTFLFIVIIMSFFPASTSSQDSSEPLYGLLFTGPIALYFLSVLLQRRRYSWNWWKKTLIISSAFWSSLMVFGTILSMSAPAPASVQESDTGPLAQAPLYIIFLSLLILGKEKFSTIKVS